MAVGADRLAYGELDGLVRRTARAIGPSSRVALLLPNGIAFGEAFLAALLAGAAVAVLDPDWTCDELDSTLDTIAPDVIVTTEDRLARCKLPRKSRSLICTGDRCRASDLNIDQTASFPRVFPESPFYIGFTSGTTGVPKAYVRSHRSWLASMDAAAEEFPVFPGERVLIPGPLSQSMFLYAVLETLSAGAAAFVLARFDTDAALAVLERESMTRLHAVPTMLAALADAAEARSVRAESVGTLISAGDKLPPSLRERVQERFPRAAIFEYYGASELSFVSVAPAAEGWPSDSVGRPFRSVAVEVRREDGSPAPTDDVGQLWVKSDMICSGYLQDLDDVGFRVRDGWATVGDMARLDATGALFLSGREGGMVVTGGRNVYPAEAEAVLRDQPEVAEALVIALPDTRLGNSLCAVIQWRNSGQLTRDELTGRCLHRLSRYKCPRRYFIIDRFPLTRSGKIASEQVRDRLLSPVSDLQEIV